MYSDSQFCRRTPVLRIPTQPADWKESIGVTIPLIQYLFICPTTFNELDHPCITPFGEHCGIKWPIHKHERCIAFPPTDQCDRGDEPFDQDRHNEIAPLALREMRITNTQPYTSQNGTGTVSSILSSPASTDRVSFLSGSFTLSHMLCSVAGISSGHGGRTLFTNCCSDAPNSQKFA